jgi:hypothetical protein
MFKCKKLILIKSFNRECSFNGRVCSLKTTFSPLCAVNIKALFCIPRSICLFVCLYLCLRVWGRVTFKGCWRVSTALVTEQSLARRRRDSLKNAGRHIEQDWSAQTGLVWLCTEIWILWAAKRLSDSQEGLLHWELCKRAKRQRPSGSTDKQC